MPIVRQVGPKPSKPLIKPRAKMKVVHWKRILLSDEARTRVVNGDDPQSIWEGLPEPRLDDVEERAFCAAFCARAAAARRSKAEGVTTAAPITKVLEPKRSNAVAIMMASLPPVHEVKLAILTLDESILSREQLEKLRLNLPTPEEMEELKRLDGPNVRWDKPEQFQRIIMRVPRLRARLRCWSVKFGFFERVEEILEPLRAVSEAVAEVKRCAVLRPLLSLLLALGNHMNGGTARGQADGFAILDLPKASLVKSVGSTSVSLVEYTVRELLRRGGVGETIANDAVVSDADAAALLRGMHAAMPHLREASKVSIGDADAALRRLKADAAALLAAAEAPEEESTACGGVGSDDPFPRTMRAFHAEAAAELALVEAARTTADKSVESLRNLFSPAGPANLKPAEPSELFQALAEFADAVDAAVPKRSAAKALWRRAIEQVGHGDGASASVTVSSKLERAPARDSAAREPDAATVAAAPRSESELLRALGLEEEIASEVDARGGGDAADLQRRLEERFQQASLQLQAKSSRVDHVGTLNGESESDGSWDD